MLTCSPVWHGDREVAGGRIRNRVSQSPDPDPTAIQRLWLRVVATSCMRGFSRLHRHTVRSQVALAWHWQTSRQSPAAPGRPGGPGFSPSRPGRRLGPAPAALSQ
jgi:hypothetical protein